MDAARVGELAAADRVVLHELTPRLASLEEAYMELTADSSEYGVGAPPTDDAAPTDGAAPDGAAPADTASSTTAPSTASSTTGQDSQ
jgi:ABC-2 type transport system ATP-binding protein